MEDSPPEQTMPVISQEYPQLPRSRRRVVFKLPDYLLRDTAAPRLKIAVAECL